MSELMEKDVLMEEVAATIAYIASRTHNNPQTHTFCNELKSCGALRETLLVKAPKDIDAVVIRAKLSELKNSVKDNPVNFLDSSLSDTTTLPTAVEDLAPSKEIIDNVFAYITNFGSITPCNSDTPEGFVLGGQPGARKAYLTEYIKRDLPNSISINGDEFRSWHPYFDKIQLKYGKNSSKITGSFAGKVTEAVLNKALQEKYNIIIEGTFRTAKTPLKTLQDLKAHHYKTNVFIKTCPSEVSWSRCLSRYKIGLNENDGKERFTAKDHHDLVVNSLPDNADIVFKSGIVDRFAVFGVTGEMIFDSLNNAQNQLPSVAITKELNTKS